jgi:hypothetical protein
LEVVTFATVTTDFVGATVADTFEATTTVLTADAFGTRVAAAADARD